MRRHILWLAVAVLAVAVPVGRTGTVSTTAGTAPLPPAQDPFYRYSGSTPLTGVAPGTVLARRTVHLGLGTAGSTPVTATQLLYRTTGQLGQPTVTVTTVLEPTPVPVAARIVEYLSFYDGLASQCDPSYTLQGGDPGTSTTEEQADEEELLVAWYLSQGDIVTIPDFEGTGLDWMAGRESGQGSLDAIRATESALALPAATPVGLSGYSGGAMAADWAGEYQSTYAPELHIAGIALGGLPVNYFHLFGYVDGTTTYSAAIPGMLLGLARAYGVDLSTYLSPYGAQVVGQEAGSCMASDFGAYPGLTLAALMKPGDADLSAVPVLDQMVAEQTMGTGPGHPTAPLLMGVGNADGVGDGVMNASDVEGLARSYCHQGVPVEFQEYPGASHEEAGAFFEPQTGPFLQARLAGLPFVGDCASLG